MAGGMNSTEMLKKNRSLVLKTFLENDSLSRAELAREVGLQKATITNIVNEFMKMGIIGIKDSTTAGRRGEKIGVRVPDMYILAMSINRKNFKASIFTVTGRQLKNIQGNISSDSNVHDILNDLVAAADSLFKTFGKENVIGACLGLPGPYIRKNRNLDDEIIMVSKFEQLSQINVRKYLEDHLEIRVLSEHDAKLSAFAEWKNSQEAKEDKNVSLMALTSVGVGIGAGIVIGGKIVEGQLGISGEIGKLGINYNGKFENGQYTGSFEYAASTDSTLRYMVNRLYEFPNSCLKENSSYQDVLEAYNKKDPLAICSIDRMAWMLGYGIASIIYIINPDCIVVGLDYPDSEYFLNKVKESITRMVPPVILEDFTIRCSKIHQDTVLLGGYYYVIEQLLNNNELLDKIQTVIDKRQNQ